jgi:hypothetical protein
VDCRITEYPDTRDRLIGPVVADWRVLRVHAVRISDHSLLGGRGCARVNHQVSRVVVSWPLMMDALRAGWADKATIACALAGLSRVVSQPSPAPWITRGRRHRSRRPRLVGQYDPPGLSSGAPTAPVANGYAVSSTGS